VHVEAERSWEGWGPVSRGGGVPWGWGPGGVGSCGGGDEGCTSKVSPRAGPTQVKSGQASHEGGVEVGAVVGGEDEDLAVGGGADAFDGVEHLPYMV
jgi:hypothetical protein